ncbi:MAG TPA: DUF5658 family protein [Vicinamibacterales bacterium]|nr:DUF5658 family protein [Vicinamibacterales bacterium]
MMIRRAAALVLIFSLLGTPAFASDAASAAKAPAPSPAAAADVASEEPLVPGLAPIQIGAPTRGAVLPLLYGSYAALQAFDAVSTLRGVQLGAQEANPVMSGLSRNPAGMWALKGGLTAASIVAAEHLWKQRRRGEAIALMVVANGIMAGVAARNAAVVNGLR